MMSDDMSNPAMQHKMTVSGTLMMAMQRRHIARYGCEPDYTRSISHIWRTLSKRQRKDLIENIEAFDPSSRDNAVAMLEVQAILRRLRKGQYVPPAFCWPRVEDGVVNPNVLIVNPYLD